MKLSPNQRLLQRLRKLIYGARIERAKCVGNYKASAERRLNYYREHYREVLAAKEGDLK